MAYHPDLMKVAVLIKTFLRDHYLLCAIDGIVSTMPEVQMIIVDDGDHSEAKNELYVRLRTNGHKVYQMPFDSGFGAKSNAGISDLMRPYLLIGSDDFNFHSEEVRRGVEKLVAVLDGTPPKVAVASGRVNGNRYEGWLMDSGDKVSEEFITFNAPKHACGVEYFLCNLTVNYSLIRKEILGFGEGQISWDDDIKIGGGEHGAQFIKIMRAGYKVAYVPGVNINEQQSKPVDPRYSAFRARARQPGRLAFRKLGIKEYTCFGGSVEVA